MTEDLKPFINLAQGNQEVIDWTNTTLNAYWRKAFQNLQPTYPDSMIEHIIDYLVSPEAPKRLRKMSIDQAKAGAEKWMKTKIKNGSHIAEKEDDIKVVLRSPKSGMTLVRLIGKKAFEREGHLMKHCVAGYADRDPKQTEIYSLRDKENTPHCTMEITNNGDERRIQQIKGKANGQIHPKYIKYVLKALKHLKIEVRDSEMGNLGYHKLSDDLMKFIEENFNKDEIKFTKFNGKKYYCSITNPKDGG